MDLLVLGGTVFLGRHTVERALAAGHRVTLFHRGRSNPGLFPDAVSVHGDRDGGLDALEGRRFDAVLDMCGYVPRLVGEASRRFPDSHYTFISSLSVYADNDTPGQDEDAVLVQLEDPTIEEVTGETYGGLKALCENAVVQERRLIVRPGLIVGPHDPTDRFTYWPVRLARPGRALVPGPRAAAAELTDVRDLAAWIVDAVERDVTGVYNVSGKTTRGALFDLCAGPETELVWHDLDWFVARGVQPWVDLPLCVDAPGFSTRSEMRARAAGLVHRPVEETIRDTRAWAGDRPLMAGLPEEREQELL